ncbi:FliO/MopB family protein [Glacieibacterium frigidum]|uniref:Flagellar biosynthetic protein FliO n=1 Tax=Glacieibacterium frigidum TaxID=2593303 RepID=A0A552UGM0_9SPHN|nr:flagellar biosynthetic protein FliO [Glacieibacterium frigidum]TRW17364.1 flagellar biosynthetic protein FliO [Glacieibacterium frigidum]
MTGETSVLTSIVTTIVALLIVLALAWGALRLLKYMQDRQIGGVKGEETQALRFLRALPVGTRERVMLIEAEGERLLIGVTAGGITLLARWPAGAVPPTLPGDQP